LQVYAAWPLARDNAAPVSQPSTDTGTGDRGTGATGLRRGYAKPDWAAVA